VVLIAGMFASVDERRAQAIGCAEVLVKPLKPQHIAARLHDWLDAPPPSPPIDVTEHAASVEEYFSRLDAAFKSLERPLADDGTGDGDSAPAAGSPPASGEGSVPTLQELLNRL